MQKTFTEVILFVYSVIFFILGIVLLIFTKEMSLITIVGIPGKVTIVIQQFLGSAYLLLGFMMYIAKGLKGKPLYITIAGAIIIGFIHLYLIFVLDELINLPTVYFIYLALVQVVLLFTVIEQVKRN